MTYYVSIGNSDDKLGQARWATYQASVLRAIQVYANEIHGVWYSSPMTGYQNMCVCFELYAIAGIELLKEELRSLAKMYNQDSIALAKAETEFISGK